MSGVLTAIITGITAFTATNIDDLVILLLFFSQVNATFQSQHILLGQYLGFSVLIMASLPGFFGGLIISRQWIGLLGLLPIAIGLSRWLNHAENFEHDPKSQLKEVNIETQLVGNSLLEDFLSPQIYSVAAITVANGGDNISVYVPLFANSSLLNMFLILGVFFLLLGVWCYVAYKLTHNLAIANFLPRYANIILPFILIGLGVFIILQSQALSLTKLFLCTLCLIIIVKC